MSSRNKKNIFKTKKNKKSILPSKVGKKTIRPKSVKSKKPTKEVVSETKVSKKKSFVRREADKNPEVVDSNVHVAPPAEVTLDQPVEAHQSHEEIVPPITSGVETSSQEAEQTINEETAKNLSQKEDSSDKNEISDSSFQTTETIPASENISNESDQKPVNNQVADSTVKKDVPPQPIKKGCDQVRSP